MGEGRPETNAMSLLRTTVELEEQAKSMARSLVEGGWAACVHVQRITSWYQWEDKLEQCGEWLIEARVPPIKLDAAWEHVLSDHPYELPLVEVMPEMRVTARYAAWAAQVTGDRASPSSG